MLTNSAIPPDHPETANDGLSVPPTQNTEVRPTRRRFTIDEKIRIMHDIDAAKAGDKGVIMRREGVYSSTICGWRKQLAHQGSANAQKRGRKPALASTKAAEIAHLRRQLARSEEHNRRLGLIVEFQKKLSEMLGIAQPELTT